MRDSGLEKGQKEIMEQKDNEIKKLTEKCESLQAEIRKIKTDKDAAELEKEKAEKEMEILKKEGEVMKVESTGLKQEVEALKKAAEELQKNLAERRASGQLDSTKSPAERRMSQTIDAVTERRASKGTLEIKSQQTSRRPSSSAIAGDAENAAK